MYRAALGKIKRIMHAPSLVVCTDRVLVDWTVWTRPNQSLDRK